jgi:hypothetical protein
LLSLAIQSGDKTFIQRLQIQKAQAMRKHFLRLFLSACLLSLLPGQTLAWNAKGHRIIARLAWEQLDAQTKNEVVKLLGNSNSDDDPLTAVATWADDISVKSPASRKWHVVEIPANVSSYSPSRDCPGKNCLVERINIYRYQLQNGSRAERVEALKYLVHLIGDLHQPLHCYEKGDFGGNKVSVTFFGQSTNLHKVWDGDIIDWTGLNEADYVKKLKQSRLPVAQNWVTEWVNESHMLAPTAYNFGRDGKLGTLYYKTMLPVVDTQLARGGVRLAHVLPYAFGLKK